MRLIFVLFFVISSLTIAGAADVNQTWGALQAKRDGLKGFHQEFEISRAFKVGQKNQSSKSYLVLDCTRERWREHAISLAGDRTTVFNGKEQFELEDGANEYVRVKRGAREDLPRPCPYSVAHLDLARTIERERRPCGLSNVEHECVILEIPVKPWSRNLPNGSTWTSRGGAKRFVFDTSTGLLISSRMVENIDDHRAGYQSDVLYVLKRMSFDSALDDSLFVLPPTATREVKELSRSNADKIKKQLAGRAAPELALTDLAGKPVTLNELKGKTILLDFWATWCGPCRADGPSLDKLHEKYGDKNLAIIGISVDEERPVVEKFLTEHPHKYPIALTTENEMPRAYQIGVFPTYIVIDADGNVTSAAEGEKGFSELRRLLKKAGLETD